MKTDSNNCYYSRSQCVCWVALLDRVCVLAFHWNQIFSTVRHESVSSQQFIHLFVFWITIGLEYGNESPLKATPTSHRDLNVHSNQKVIHFMEKQFHLHVERWIERNNVHQIERCARESWRKGIPTSYRPQAIVFLSAQDQYNGSASSVPMFSLNLSDRNVQRGVYDRVNRPRR